MALPVLNPGSLLVRMLPDTLWSSDAASGRSSDITPLYVERYQGRHASKVILAHDFWECVAVLGGSLELVSEGTVVRLRAGDMCFIPPGLTHREQSRAMVENLWIGLVGSRLTALLHETERIPFAQALEAVSAAETMWKRAQNAYGLAGPELDGHALVVFGLFLRARTLAMHEGEDLVASAVTLMRENFATLGSVATIAAKLGVSEGHFSRVFRSRTEASPLQYLLGIRMEHACRWLERSGMSVTEVARMCGFADPLYFSRAFRRHTGQGPRDYRKACLEPSGPFRPRHGARGS